MKHDQYILFTNCVTPSLTEPTVYTNSHYGDGDGAIVYYNTSCRGYESSIVGCSKQMYGTFTCSRNNVAGVACQEGTVIETCIK